VDTYLILSFKLMHYSGDDNVKIINLDGKKYYSTINNTLMANVLLFGVAFLPKTSGIVTFLVVNAIGVSFLIWYIGWRR
jgi:hypothetical protein